MNAIGRWYVAGICSLLIICGTGLVSKWGEWYSPWPGYRLQSEALLSGRLALSNDPADIDWDNTWSMGGVQQVWGLGVPFWRTPFLALAKVAGFPLFPDRLAFGLFILLVAYLILNISRDLAPSDSQNGRIIGVGITQLVLIGFPPLLSMIRFRLAVYEEAIAYSYFYALFELTLLLKLMRDSRIRTWIFLCIVSGLGGLVRPTLVFYGIASVACGAVGMLPDWKAKWSCLRRLPIYELLAGISLFCAGGGVLWLTNYERFGDGFEFGHRINLQTRSGAMYATRFDHPFQDISAGDAAKELFGALFLPKAFNDYNYQATSIFPGQSSAVRWREFTFDTYNVGHLLLILAGWGLAAVAFITCCRRKLWFKASDRDGIDSRTVAIFGLWSVISSVLLSCIFWSSPWMASRYTLDYGPAFAIAILVVFLTMAARAGSTRGQAFLAILILAGWTLDLSTQRSAFSGPKSATLPALNFKNGKEDVGNGIALPGNAAVLGDKGSGIPFDRQGWNQTNGCLSTLLILFVNNPKFLELNVEERKDKNENFSPKDFRAKIESERLAMESVERTSQGWKVRFQGPKDMHYRQGLQTAFVATVPKENLADPTTPWILKSAQWSDAEPALDDTKSNK